MPDISMCDSANCPSRFRCYRHEASGTKPSEFRQAYMPFDSWRYGAEACRDLLPLWEQPK